MSADFLLILVLIGGLFLLLAAGMEIAVAFGLLASIGLFYFLHERQVNIPWNAWGTMNSFTLIAMPLFVFMGQMFAKTGVISGLIDGADKWVGGKIPGGLYISVIAACAVFSAISGSSIACAATFSTTAFPELIKKGYDEKLSLGVIALGGSLDILIPPSVIFIIYGAWENVSIARLFAAGMIPGIILAIFFALTVMLLVLINPALAPKVPPVPWREKFIVIKDILPWLAIIAIVMGTIFGGVMTATEASALGAFLSIVFTLIYRKFTFIALRESLISAVGVAAMVGFIMVTSRALSLVFQSSGLTKLFSSFVLSLPLGKFFILTLLNIMYLILGCFFDAAAMLFLTMPFVMPLIKHFHLDPVWWGVVYVLLAQLGMLTPPFGLILFTMHGILPKYSILTIARATLPFFIPIFVVIYLLIFFPDLALWLPSVLY